MKQCKHSNVGWRLVYRAIDVKDRKHGNIWNHYQWLEEAICCNNCGVEIKQ